MFVYKKRRRRIYFLIILLILIFIFFYFITQFKIAFINISKAKIYAIALQTINDIVNEKMSNIDYNTLINYQKNENDEITVVNTNVVLMNYLANEISNEIINKLDAISSLNIEIPIGTITGNELLYATGPSIKIKVIPINEVKTEFKTDFYSTGINQSKHKIFLNVYCNVEALNRFMSNDINIELQIPILETVIIGNVPNTYYQIEGLDKNNMYQILD